MASLIDELIDILDNECEIYKQLLPLADEKTQIIVKNNLVELQNITEKEQSVVEQINALEHKRENIIANIATVINKKPETLNLKTIIKLLEKQPKEQKALSGLRDNLNQILQRLVELNERNKVLIQQSLEMIEFNMNFIQSTRAVPGNNTYTKGASQYDTQAFQTGMFDAKQ